MRVRVRVRDRVRVRVRRARLGVLMREEEYGRSDQVGLQRALRIGHEQHLKRHAGLQRWHILAPSRHAAHSLEQACAEGLLIPCAVWLLTLPAKKRVEPLRLEEELHLG